MQNINNVADTYTKAVIKMILKEGCLDNEPRPHWADGTPANTLSINHVMLSYDLSKGELPLITLRPIAVKKAIGELLWIYQHATSNLAILEKVYGVRWWREWCINPYHFNEFGVLIAGANPFMKKGYYYDSTGTKINLGKKSITTDEKDIDTNGYILDPKSGNVLTGEASIGHCYGNTVARYDLMNKLLDGIKNNPDGRRHIINLWQEEEFCLLHGLKPCAYQTVWNVRHGKDGIDYLDMCLFQRSSDFLVAGCINQLQYVILQYLVARHTGYTPGKFSWMVDNVQIYDRHTEQAKEILTRESIICQPKIWINPEKTDFYSMTLDDIKIIDYPINEIRMKNPTMKFEVAI